MAVGESRAGPVRVAWATAGRDLPPRDFASSLSAQQHGRHASLPPGRAERFLLGRWLMTRLITQMSDVPDPQLSSICVRCGADHGAPVCTNAPVAVSVSYAGNLVAAAAVLLVDAAAVGIDVERQPDGAGPGRMTELARLFAPAPPPDLRGWTLLEAALKADGRGLVVDPARVVFGARCDDVLPGAHRVEVPGGGADIDASPAPAPEGFVLSVAVARPASGP